MTLPPTLKQKVLAEISSERAPTRREDRVRRVAWLVLGLGVLVGATMMRGVAYPTSERPQNYVLVCVGVMLLCALGTTAWVLSSGGNSLGRSQKSLRALAISVPVLMALGALAGNAAAPVTGSLAALEWPSHGMCLSLYAALGGALLLILILGLRPLDPVAPATTGAALGAVVGAWTSLVVSLVCPSPEREHVLMTHVGPSLIFIGIGALLGGHLLTVRYRSRREPPSR